MPCEFCGNKRNHLPGCPAAPTPAAVHVCDNCGEDICRGEYVFQLMGDRFCKACIVAARERVQ